MVTRRALMAFPLALTQGSVGAAAPSFRIRRDVPLQKDSQEFCWFHPRVGAIPGKGDAGAPLVVMTLSQHLDADDHYSGLWYMSTRDLGRTWTEPKAPPVLAAQKEADGLHSSVHDVTPGWHPQSGKLLAIGARTFYRPDGKHISDQIKRGGTAYAAYDPKADAWSEWQAIEFPADPIFVNCRCASSQWLVKPNGRLLLACYFQDDTPYYGVTVVECEFDGKRMKSVRHGTVLSDKTKRGLAEPSIIWQGGRYYLTIRHDDYGYVATSRDGLTYGPMKKWTFDDGADLGSVNTQQHWLAHSDGLYLSYTSRREENRHIARARAPLFIGQVDTEKLCVVRSTEQVLIPERGLMLGNFGAAAITPGESWVTDAEFIWYRAGLKPTAAGGNGSVWVARVEWEKPNRLAR